MSDDITPMLEFAKYRLRNDYESRVELRRALIRDERITDAQFLSVPEVMPRDYDDRVDYRVLRQWGRRAGLTDELIENISHIQPHQMSGWILSRFSRLTGDRVALATMYEEICKSEFEARIWICFACRKPRTMDDVVVGDRQGRCAECHREYYSRPSSPPASGLKPAVARARRAGLPATLTGEQWQRTVAHFADRCAYCGGPWTVVEHATSVSRGGGTVADNCLPSCQSCNALKRSLTIEELLCASRFDGWDPARLGDAIAWLRGLGRKATP